MRSTSLEGGQARLRRDLANLNRRVGWLLDNLSPSRTANAARALFAFAARRERPGCLPLFLKIDATPLCNLACTVCVHARRPSSADRTSAGPAHARRMPLASYRRIVDEVRGKTAAVSLGYLGDPLMHPDIEEMCQIARAADLNAHVGTNFSFHMSDETIRALADSGLTHLTVCVDGLSQSTYARTRIGGDIALVIDNLRRICSYRRASGHRYPKIEVQYLRFRHNLGEEARARDLFEAFGVDQVTTSWGDVHHYSDVDVSRCSVGHPRHPSALPSCFWPYLAMLIRYDGEAIPCCEHRMLAQNPPGPDARTLGSVFSRGVRDIWTSEACQVARRVASNPRAFVLEPQLTGHFCHGCHRLFETDRPDRWRSAVRFDLPSHPTEAPHSGSGELRQG